MPIKTPHVHRWLQNPYEGLSQEFMEEWKHVEDIVRSDLLRHTTDLNMTPACTAYVQKLRGYHRLPYLTTMWVQDVQLRRSLGVAFGIHCVGIKLLDDLIDQDQEFHPIDLALGSQLINIGVASMCAHANSALIANSISEDYRVIWAQQWSEINCPARDLESWCRYAWVKAGLVMGCYAQVAQLAAGSKNLVQAARAFAENYGILVMMSDDLKDYIDLHETAGNLGHLIASDHIGIPDLRKRVASIAAAAIEPMTTSHMAHNIELVVTAHQRDILEFQLNDLCAAKESEKGS